MLITVITICYNAEQFIERTLQSVVNQTFQDYEFLIQDGGSSDRTIALVEKYKTDKFSIYREKDNGIYDALNKALAHARGEYVCFLHAGDTFFSKDTLDKIFSSSGLPDFIYGDTLILNEQSGKTRPWFKKKPALKDFSYRSFLNGMVVCHQSMVVKREKCQAYTVGKWKIANDLDWTIRTLKNCKSYKDTEFPITYFLEGGVSDQRRKQALKERFQILREHFGIIPTLLQHAKIFVMAIFRGSVS